MDVLQADARRPVPALRHRPARGAALPRLPDADRDPARGRPDRDAGGGLVLPAGRGGDVVPHRPREVDDHRRVDRRGRQDVGVLPQRRLPRAVRRGLRQALRDLLRRRAPADLRGAPAARRRPGADRRLAQARGARAADGLPGPAPRGQPVRALLRPARGRPARAPGWVHRGLPRLCVPQPTDDRRLDGAAGRPRALAVRRGGREGRGPARRRGRRLQDAALPAGPAACLRRGRRGRADGRGVRRCRDRARLSGFLNPVRTVLQFERLTPEPGPDADAIAHEFVAHCTADEAGVLEVGGIATVWDLLVDGAVVASGRSMFERHVVDVEAGDHEVRIVVHPLTDLLDALPSRPRQRWRTMLVEDARLRWVRTQLLGRAPGFSPGPPVVGPYRPVTLVTGARPRPLVRAWLEDTTGVVEVDGKRRLELPDVELWWPHTHGTPKLHDVVVDGEVVGRVGFRTVENRSEHSLDLWVNGVRVFCRGAVWTPGDLAALDEAVALGLNLVRVPGIAAYESDAFHERCDELGLLVWQDLMFATLDYPLADDEFVATIADEVRDQTRRLLSHPSTVVVCGSAEHEQQAAMFGVSPETGYAGELAALLRPLVEESGLDAVWVDSSPSGGDPVTRVDQGIAQYFGVGAYLRDLPDVRHSRVGFAAECLAFSNLTDPLVRGGVPRDNGAEWDFADVRAHYLWRRYEGDATQADAQRVTGEVMAEVFGEWRGPGAGWGGGVRSLVPGA